MLKNMWIALGLVVSLVSALPSAHGVSVDWTGTYRFEYGEINSAYVGGPPSRKAYALNSLSLTPKIIALDGVNIVANFQILNNPQYPGSQMGQLWGMPNTALTTGGTTSSLFSQSQGPSSIEVRHLYLSASQEYGALLVGRAPLHFGLGMTFNAGNGPFDHWADSHDILAYKFLIGNLSITPMLGRPVDRSIAQGDDANDAIVEVVYNNPETESLFGLIYNERKGSVSANDASRAFGGTPTTHWSTRRYNLLFGRGWEGFKFKFEAGFFEGGTGVTLASQTEELKINSYAIVSELDFSRPQSRWDLRMKLGIVSGDNPDTANTYEGFNLNRNYDVAFMLFNHPMGQFDIFRTSPQRQRSSAGTVYDNALALDEEVISNSFFLSPQLDYKFADQWTWRNTLTYAQLMSVPLSNAGVSKDVGFEWDTGILFRPHERVQWLTEIGMLFPGSAFKGGSNNFDNAFTFGWQTKLAISF